MKHKKGLTDSKSSNKQPGLISHKMIWDEDLIEGGELIRGWGLI